MERSRLPLFNENRYKIGIFCMNVSAGASMSKAPGILTPTWAENVRIAQAADDAGWEFLLPLGSWKGAGGETDPHDRSFEVYTWASGIAAVTKQIQVFTTSHLRLVHPMMAAKQGVTLDHIAGGRSALNIVAGQYPAVVGMFGMQQIDHGSLYECADEWTTLVKRLYTEEEGFDFEGRFFRMKGGRINPKPLQKPYPVIVNAGQSGAGRRFGAKHADFTFLNVSDLEEMRRIAAEVRETARTEFGREMGILNHGYMVARDTEKEALEYERYFIDECGDWAAAEAYIETYATSGSQSFSMDWLREHKRGCIAGFNGVRFVGTPEQIVDKMLLLSEAGINGSAFDWIDYEAGVEYFNRRVLPLMIQAGLRVR